MIHNPMKTIVLLITLHVSTFSFSQFGTGQNILNSTLDPLNIISFDLDNDGDMEVISSSQGDNKIAIYENIGGDQFNQQKIISSSALQVKSIFAADINGDGNGDIIAASFSSNEIYWFENLGGLEFGNKIIISSSVNGASYVHVEDIDGDGDNDIVAASYNDDKIIWFENLGGGLFSNEIIISNTADGASSVYVKDMDGDGDVDILSSSYLDDKIAWYENLGGGSFSSENIISTSVDGAQFIIASDLDNDGDNDLITIASLDSVVSTFENTGAGMFVLNQVITSSVSSCQRISVSDLDNDGDVDLIVPGVNINNILNTVVYENSLGNFGLGISVSYNSQGNVLSFDKDNDGLIDIMSIGNDYRKIFGNINLGNLSFGPDFVISTDTPDQYPDGKFIDIDSDGDEDIVFYNGESLKWYENLGGGEFGASQRLISDTIISYTGLDFISGDLDSDGDIDLIGILPGPNNASLKGFGWLENDGSQNFSNYQSISTDIHSCNQIIFKDVDNDGVKDVTIGTYAAQGEIAWFKNLGSAVFGAKNVITENELEGVKSISLNDLNNNGQLDLVTASSTDDKIAWFENSGGSFGAQQIISTNADAANQVYVADFDNDGYNDVVSASVDDNKIAWYKNLGNGSFSNEIVIDVFTSSAFSVKGSDMDNDGDIDIVGSFAFAIKWYENQGDGTFSSGEDINMGFYSSFFPLSLFVSDVNGDTDNDILMFYTDPITFAGGIVLYSNLRISSIQISGRTYIDLNQNGAYDSTDYYANEIGIMSSPQSAYTYTYSDGKYFMNFEDLQGAYEISANIPEYWSISTDSVIYNVIIDSSFTNRDSLDFGFFPDTIIDVLTSDLIGGFPRCNTDVNYWINLSNEGTTVPSGMVHLTLDDSVSYVNSSMQPDSIIGQDIYWSYDSLSYFTNQLINVEVHMPDFLSIDDTIYSYLEISVDSIPLSQFSSMDTLEQVIKCAYDPNIKTAIPSGVGESNFILPNTNSIEYIIEFQNTGNDTAITIRIDDQLLENVNIYSFEPIASSHEYNVQISNIGLVSFTFENIMLPDSNINELGSHGFIKYKIDLLPNLPHGTLIENSAQIYFDSNPPILTNTKTHIIFDCINNFNNELAYSSPILTALNQESSYEWIDCTNDSIAISNENNQSFEPLLNGEYAVILSNDICYKVSDCYSVIDLVGMDELNSFPVKIYPNPTHDKLFIEALEKVESIQILDMNGKVIFSDENYESKFKVDLNLENISKGMYTIRIITANHNNNQIFIVQ